MSGCFESNSRKYLPISATEINEYYDSSWNGDYVRLLKAKLPYQDFQNYAKALRLNGHYTEGCKIDQETKSLAFISFMEAPEWWNPPDKEVTKEFYYSHPSSDEIYSLTWHAGYVYNINYVW